MSVPEEPKINKPKPQGFKRVFSTLCYSIKGLRSAWKYEESFRLEVYVALLALPCSLLIGRNWVEYVLLLGSLMFVLIIELLNSALETTIDRISTDFHELSGRAKDIGSAAAFLSMLMAGIIWLSLIMVRLLG